MAKSLKVSGIHRAAKNRLHPEGSCNEIVNLRHREGAWEAIGDKKQFAEIPGLKEFRCYHDLGSNNYAIIYTGGEHVYTGTAGGNPVYLDVWYGLMAYVFYNGNFTTQKLSPFDESFDVKVGTINNVVVYNTDNAINYFVFQDGKYIASNIDYSSFRVYRDSLLPENNYKWVSREGLGAEVYKKSLKFDNNSTATFTYLAPVPWDGYSTNINAVFTLARRTELLTFLTDAKTALETAGVPVGRSFFMCTIELYDGTEVAHTMPQFFYAGHLEIRFYEASYDGVRHNSAMLLSGFCPDYDTSKGMAFKLEGLDNIPTGLIKGVKIYSTNPVPFNVDIKPDSSSDFFGPLTEYFRAPSSADWGGYALLTNEGKPNYILPTSDRGGLANTATSRFNDWSYRFFMPEYKDFPDFDDVYYHVATIDVNDISNGVGYCKFDCKFGETEIVTKPHIPVDNNSRNHTTFFNTPIQYNGRLFLSNIKSIVDCGFSFSGLNGSVSSFASSLFAPFKSHFTDVLNNRTSSVVIKKYTNFSEGTPILTTYWTGPTQFYLDLPIIHAKGTSHGQHMPGDYSADGLPRWWNADTSAWVTVDPRLLFESRFFYEVTIPSDSGDLLYRSPIETLKGCFVDGSNKKYVALDLWPFAFPDGRANKVRFYVQLSSSANAYTWYSKAFDLTPSALHNFSYIALSEMSYTLYNGFGEETSKLYSAFMVVRSSDFVSQLPDIETITLTHAVSYPSIVDDNRVQASALNNPYVFPAINSYRVGTSEIMGLHTINQELSQGQFGEYPVIAFTKSGIWALNIASGDTLISSVVPLVNEVCNNMKSITAIRKGIFFSTSEGLKILQGSTVTDISDVLEGNPANAVKSSSVLSQILSNDNLSEVLSNDDFLTYVNGAQIGYDAYYEEIIVSNIEYTYSYVYSLQNSTWTKRAEVFNEFLNQFPHLLCVKDSSIFFSDQETRTGKATLIVSNPIGQDLFFKIEQFIARGVFNSQAKLMIFASTDNRNYRLVSSKVASECYDISLPRAPYSFKSFIIAFEAIMDADSYLTQFDMSMLDRYNTKLR